MHKNIVKLMLILCFAAAPMSVSAQSINIQNAPIPLSQLMNTASYQPPITESYENQDIFMPNTYDSSLSTKTLNGRVYTVPAGNSFTARIQTTLNSKTVKTGDTVAAVLDKDWMHNNQLIAPAGSLVYGEIKKSEQSGKAMKNGHIEMKFTEVETPYGDTIELSANTVVIKVDQNRTWEVTKNVAAKTATGAATGAVISMGRSSSWEQVGKITTVTTALGFIWGIFDTMTSHEGEEVELPVNTELSIRLIEPVNISNEIINQVY